MNKTTIMHFKMMVICLIFSWRIDTICSPAAKCRSSITV